LFHLHLDSCKGLIRITLNRSHFYRQNRLGCRVRLP
jgi:hypothetical protein